MASTAGDMSLVCRCCLQKESELLNIFEEIAIGDPLSFAVLVENCIGIEIISGDGLPKYICTKCSTDVTNFFDFKKMCLQSEKILRPSAVVQLEPLKNVACQTDEHQTNPKISTPPSSEFEKEKQNLKEDVIVNQEHQHRNGIEVEENGKYSEDSRNSSVVKDSSTKKIVVSAASENAEKEVNSSMSETDKTSSDVDVETASVLPLSGESILKVLDIEKEKDKDVIEAAKVLGEAVEKLSSCNSRLSGDLEDWLEGSDAKERGEICIGDSSDHLSNVVIGETAGNCIDLCSPSSARECKLGEKDDKTNCLMKEMDGDDAIGLDDLSNKVNEQLQDDHMKEKEYCMAAAEKITSEIEKPISSLEGKLLIKSLEELSDQRSKYVESKEENPRDDCQVARVSEKSMEQTNNISSDGKEVKLSEDISSTSESKSHLSENVEEDPSKKRLWAEVENSAAEDDFEVPSAKKRCLSESEIKEVEKMEEVAEKVEVSSEKMEEVAEKVEVSSEKIEEVAEKVEVSSEKMEEVAEKMEVSSEKIEEVAEKVEVSSEKIEEVAEKVEVSSEKIEEVAEKMEVSSDKLDPRGTLENLLQDSEEYLLYDDDSEPESSGSEYVPGDSPARSDESLTFGAACPKVRTSVRSRMNNLRSYKLKECRVILSDIAHPNSNALSTTSSISSRVSTPSQVNDFKDGDETRSTSSTTAWIKVEPKEREEAEEEEEEVEENSEAMNEMIEVEGNVENQDKADTEANVVPDAAESQGVSAESQRPLAKFVSGRKRFLCPFCAKAFRTKSQMMLHRSLHTGDLPYPCEVCGKRFPLRCRLLRHMSVHDASITCEFCGMDFKTNILLGRHIKARHTIPSYTYAPVITQPQPVANKSGQRFPCRLCPKVFSTVNGLKVHKRVHVNTTVKVVPLTAEKEKQEEKTAVSLQDTCKICGMSFPNALYLKSHMVCHNIIRPNSGKLMSIESSKPTENTEDSRAGVNPDKSIAKSCDESVNMMEPTVLIHESSSSFGEPSFQQQNQPYNRMNRFSCSVCSQIFQSRSQMLRHQTLIHRSLKCEICACMFASAEEVQNHKLAEHPSYNADMLAKKPHKCNVCGKGFPKHCRLVQHMAVHTTVPRQSSCDQCGKYFPSPELLDIHKKTHETKEPSVSGRDPLTCGVCQRVFTKRSRLKRHMLLHESQSFPCNKCPKTFISRELLAEHQNIHSVEEEQGVSCTACGRVFTNKGRLKQHVAVHTKSGFVSCDNCFKVFANKQVLEMHAQTCANPGESSSSSQPATSSKSALTPPPPSGFASCTSCNKAFPTKNLLTEHEKTCVGLTVVKKMDGTWKVLDNEDRTRGAARSDMNSRSESLEEIKVFSCKVCNKKFSNYHGLNSHMRFHQGIHKCDLCHKKFASRNELSQHMSSHSAVYRCGICSQAFGMVDELKKHVSQCMATQSGVASNYFSCNACSEVFSFLEELAEHVRCHAGEFPHVCTECFKVFAHSLQLSRHLATHFKEEDNTQKGKHICSICQKGFVNSGALDRHKVVHSGEKRFQCSYCFQRFSQRSSLNRHQLTQHETKS